MRVTCERCLRRYDVPDATVKGRKIRARCKCGARVVVQDEERAARSSGGGSQTTGSIQRPVRWFVDITSWEPIAMDLRQLVRAFDGGRIDADTLVWRKGMPDWRRLRDVAELAERLMGADAAKAAVPDPALDSVRAEAEPPPRHAEKQPERSRTPAANYSVGSSQGRGSVPPGAPSVERISVSSSGEELVAATLPGGSMPATPAGGYSSPAPPRASMRPERRSVPSPAPTALAGRAPIMGEAPRTITQTGLAPAPDPAHRLVQSTAPAEAPITEEPEATRAGSAAVGTPRASRTPAAGLRRVPSSDETPAQKPSSISVPSGALAAAPRRLRTKHLVALGGLVLGVVFIVRGTLSSESVNGASAAGNGTPEPHATPPAGLPELPHVENRNALIPEPSAAVPAAPQPAAAFAAQVPAANPAPTTEAVVPTPTQRPARPAAAPLPARPVPAPASRAEAPVLDIRPSEPARVATATGESSPVTGRGELGAPDTPAPPVSATPLAPAEPAAPQPAAPQPAAPQPAAPQPVAANPPAAAGASRTQPTPAAPAPGAPSAAAPAPAAPAPNAPAPTAPAVSAATVGPSTAPASAAPGPFDPQRAKLQLGIAALKASTCGQLGVTRGAGEVTVVIESFGRVTRVTHANPAFVGNPVGSCITQAYQQVQVAPFTGAAQTLTSSFVVP